MRVSPAPPTTGPQSTSLTHSSHIPSTVGASSNVVMSPHPVSGQSENRNNSMHSPGYSSGGPPHMAGGPPAPHGYPAKMSHMSPGPPASPYGQPGYQQGPGSHQYPPTRPQGHIMQGSYPQNYPSGGPPGSQPSQYPPRPPHNSHVPPNQPYAYSHFGQQGWGQGIGQPMLGSGMPGKGGPSQMPGQPNPGPPVSNSVGGNRPHYLKQHMQHKIGVYQPSSGQQIYPNGPGMPPSIVNNNRESPQNNMPPPTSTPQPLTPSGATSMEVELSSAQTVPSNTISSSLNISNSTGSINSVSSSANSINSNPPQIGPDGNPMVDEASQQSTVSNTSAASGDDRSCTPKPHKEAVMGVLPLSRSSGDVISSSGQHPPSHTPTQMNSVPSPGTASMTSQQDEFENVNSPGWPRSPTGTPVYANSQPPPPTEIYRATKPGDSIMRLYEMSDSPERRAWLDKLLRFMEENKTPITACPTISKNPLDLYALYLHVRERGGFEEVTKNKHWKDVAAVMGIGASSSGSYTLRRHYMKHILAFECKFDRGGVDPQPIINQIESSQKKKTSKTLSVPSPGSNSSSMDGFTNGPHMPGAPGMPGPYSQYPPSEFPGHIQQRPPSQSTPGYQGFQGSQFPGYQGMHSGYGQAGFPPSSGYSDNRSYQPPPPPNHQSNYQGFQQPGYQRPGFPPPPPPQPSYQPDQYPMGSSGSTTNYGGSQLAKQLLNPPPRSSTNVMQGFPYPPKPGTSPSPGPAIPNSAPPFQGPRRHPDFDKGQPGWRPPSTQFGNYGPQGPPQVSGQQPWPRGSESGPSQTPSQWSQPRYPPPSSPSFPSQPRWPGSSFGSSVGGPRSSGIPSGSKSFMTSHATSFKSGGYGTYMGKQLFPMDSVEAVSPVLVKRKRMTRADISLVDPWRLLMSLRCGLASEVTWALDVLNILLFDDQTVVYFGLNHMPGLLETLIEHLRRGLINMFNICSDLELGKDDDATGANKRVKAEQHDYKDRPWFEQPPPSPTLELDLGRLDADPDPTNKDTLLKGGDVDYTVTSRNGKPVRIVKREGKIFMKEGSREWDKWEGFDCGVDTWSVGGGECTAHIICSMQSSVPPIPFTRLISGKQTDDKDTGKEKNSIVAPSPAATLTTPMQAPQVKNEKISKCRKACVTSQCVIKIEKMSSSDTEKLFSEHSAHKDLVNPKTNLDFQSTSDTKDNLNTKVFSANTFSAALAVTSQEKDVRNASTDKCNGPKDSINKPMFSSKFNRKNNAKPSKLDAIVKRIKKEPFDSLGIFSKGDKDLMQTDSKTILDHYLKKEESTESEQLDPVTVTKLPLQNKPNEENSSVVSTLSTCPQTNINESSKKSVSVDAKSQLFKSPIKLPSIPISPSKMTNAPIDRKENVGFKRPYDHVEEESWSPDEASLTTTTEGQDWLARRVIGVGTVVRNLSFIPGNEDVMSKSASLLALLGKTILLHHDHPVRSPATTHYDRDEETDFGDWCSSLASDTYWWWPYLHHVHENTLVTLANIAGHLDLSYYPEEISRPILNGLLHWATCPASYGQDAIPGGGVSAQSALSPQRLALEALVKLCVLDPNTDLVLATPPFSRLDMLCGQLTRLLCRGEDQVTREFAINLFHYFSAADSGVARVIAMQNGCVSLLVAFIEEAESAALNVANIQGVSALKENPELMGTSLDMVRRSANTLVNLSKVPDNARIITACENRFLTLVMSQILDTYVASQLSQVLFNVAQVQSENGPPPSPPLSPFTSDVSSEEKDLPASNNEEEDEAKFEKKADVKEMKEEDCVNEKRESEYSKSAGEEACSPPGSSFPNFPSTTSSSAFSSGCTSTTSSASSPMSVTSHPPLSPSTSLPLSSSYVEPILSSTKGGSGAPQATQTL